MSDQAAQDIAAAVALISAQAQQATTRDQIQRGGKVTSYNAATNRANVLIDGDTEPTPMSVYGSLTPVVNGRCWVTFTKPCGVFLSGLQ